MTKLSQKQITHLSKLANLPLDPSESSDAQEQITTILEHVDQVASLDLADIPETNQVTNKTNQFREDKITPSLTQKQALSQSKNTHNGYFVVPGVINHE
ncbi:Asp-tRNA(Asn)/Glu-tRNA(Gln) amidotransferase subunit GatC [Pseudomonadota bacterium]